MRADEHPEELIDRAMHGALDPGGAGGAGSAPRRLPGVRRAGVAWRRGSNASSRRSRAIRPSTCAHSKRRWRACSSRRPWRRAVRRRRGSGGRRRRRCSSSAPPRRPRSSASSRDGARRARRIEAPAVAPPAAGAPSRTVEAAPAEAPAPVEAPPAQAAPSARAPARPAITAAALFERGEKLRREGRADAAIAAYRRLQTAFPETPEARLSSAFAGQLLLKQRRPDEALAQFDRHLKAGGEVGEEALAGRATALEDLHRAADAIAAWKALLARYPGSVYAGRARARLDELERR